jgi:hypothetical protein
MNDYPCVCHVADLILCSQVFPSYVKRTHGISKQSALAKLKEKRSALAAAAAAGVINQSNS